MVTGGTLFTAGILCAALLEGGNAPGGVTLDLTTVEWQLYGWRPYDWMLFRSLETGQTLQAEIGPVTAKIPGSVQQALLEEGIIKDWNSGTQSRDCAWVENYHWQFHTEIPDDRLPQKAPVVLDAPGLDYAGWIYFDGKEIGRFEGTFLPHRFDLTAYVDAKRETHSLDVLFDTPPPEQGQIGFTSKSRYIKPRFAYGWDWCPRLVPIGVWDSLSIRSGLDALLHVKSLSTSLVSDTGTGRVEVILSSTAAVPEAAQYVMELRDTDKLLASVTATPAVGATCLTLECAAVEPWWPNTSSHNADGHAKTYQVQFRAVNAGGQTLWSETKQTGFRTIEWRACDEAPEGALPWMCVVNGEPTFLQGVNWSPIRPLYPDTCDEEYSRLIDLYRDMGVNCLRVNGVGLLEKEIFYELCDRAGILVWQDFPLSSSGIDNWPPEDPEIIARLVRIAESFIPRRRHHPSLLMWCGGNELQSGPNGEKSGGGKPAPADHPCLAALRETVERLDPGRRFLPTTAFGPQFYAHRDNFGKGLHHLVHGPWGMSTFQGVEDWKEYWRGDDALFRSEVGMPGAEPLALIRKYAGDEEAWPPTGTYWKHSCSWWIQWDRFKEELGDLPEAQALQQYVEETQRIQAEALAFAAKSSKDRFPACGGFLVWHGHDCFPCPINNSLIDFEGNPKPVYFGLQEVFKSQEKQP